MSKEKIEDLDIEETYVEDVDINYEEEYPEIDFSVLDGLSDDEAIIELNKMIADNDEVIERDFLSSLVEQNDERVVYYEVENIYGKKKSKRYRNRLF